LISMSLNWAPLSLHKIPCMGFLTMSMAWDILQVQKSKR
jgi:hypothetical protein